MTPSTPMHPSGDAPRSSSFRLAAVGLATVAVIGTLAVWLLSAPDPSTELYSGAPSQP